MAESSLPDIPATLFDDFSPISDDDWLSTIEDDLRPGTDRETFLTWNSLEGFRARAYYRKSDRERVDHLAAVPIARADSAPANPWRSRVNLTATALDDVRQQLHDALDAGVTDIGLAAGRSSQQMTALPLQGMDDLAVVLQDVDLAMVALHAGGGPAAIPLWAMMRTLAARRGTDHSALTGSTDYDPVAALALHHVAGVDHAFGGAAALVRSSPETPHARLLSVDLRPYHNAGASAVQELGLSLAALCETLAQLHDRGVPPTRVMETLQWIAPVDTSYFVAIAKLRALRLLIPQVLDAFDVEVAPSTPHIQSVTSQRTETRYGPYMNLLRGTTEAASAIIGGCDVLTVRPFSASFTDPSDVAHRLARNTQHILRAESHLDHVADPAAGSYYIEAITDQLARKAWSLFQTIEAEGGLLEALQAGTVQQRIDEVRAEREERVANRQHVLVGTNHYPDPGEEHPPSESADVKTPSLDRSDYEVDWTPDGNLSALQHAVADGATLGDTLDALKGPGTPSFDALPSTRLAAPFEALRERTEAWATDYGGPPRVVLLPMGDPTRRSARATFARNVLGVAGFAIDEHIRFSTPEAAARAAADADADVVVLCSSNEAYPELAPALCGALQANGIDPLVLIAGHLPEQEEALKAAGVDGFIHKDIPLLAMLADLQQRLGIG
jgi:methylmalonyl-CoA mutase